MTSSCSPIAELYDPQTGIWSTTGNLNPGRYDHTATLLPDNTVLVAAGHTVELGGFSKKAELYNPGTGTWSDTRDLHFARYQHTATLLTNGKVLVAGGQSQTGVSKKAELYTPGPPIQVTVQTNPAGHNFTVDGTTYTAAQSFSWVPGSSHTIAAISPQSGGTGVQSVWSDWSDGGAISHTITPTADTTYTADFTTQYYLTTNAGSGGTVTPASGWKNSGAMVSIVATPSPGYMFGGWTGSGTGSYSGMNNPGSITMSGPITEAAAFTAIPPIQVTVQTDPAGLAFSVDGTPYSSTHTFSWVRGSSHTIATSSPQNGAAGVRYTWMNWSDGGTRSHTVAPTTNTTYTATFTTQYYLTMAHGTGGTVTPDSGWKNRGTHVSITATPTTGYGFNSWTGTGTGSFSGTTNPVSITMSGPITETAAFMALPQIQVTVQTNPAGHNFTVDGTTYTAAQSFSWVPGSSHTIATTSPQSSIMRGVRYVWSSWTDGGAISHTVAPTTNTTYTATFGTQYTLNMFYNIGGTVSPTSGWQDSGTRVSITATRADGYTFAGWTGHGNGSYTGTNNQAVITMNGYITETATFTHN